MLINSILVFFKNEPHKYKNGLFVMYNLQYKIIEYEVLFILRNCMTLYDIYHPKAIQMFLLLTDEDII
jgi:hypothetical protein